MGFFLLATLAVFMLVFISVKWPGALSHVARASGEATVDFFAGVAGKVLRSR